jgi:hypothetical protein
MPGKVTGSVSRHIVEMNVLNYEEGRGRRPENIT